MPDRTQDELARYWDALVTGTDPSSIALDPSLAQVVQRFTEATDVPGPESTFLANLMEDLMYVHALPDARPRRPSRTIARPRIRGQLSTPALPIPGARSRWLPALISGALLVVSLGIAISQLGLGLDDNRRGPAAPAILAPASPPPEVMSDETLIEVPVPVDLLPPGEAVEAGMAMVSVPVGTFQQPGDEAATNPGIQASYILEGTVSVVSDELMHVIEAGGTGTMEEVEAGTEVVLESGDTLVTRKSPGEEWTNGGPTEVQLIALEAFGGPPATSSFPFGWIALRFDYHSLGEWPADQPTLLRLRQVTAPPETVLPLPAEALAQYTVHESDETGSSIGRRSDGSIRFVGGGDKLMTVYVFTLERLGESAATPEP